MKKIKIISIIFTLFAIILGVGFKACFSCNKNKQIIVENGIIAENEKAEIALDVEKNDFTKECIDEMIVETQENAKSENIEIAQSTEKSSKIEKENSSSQAVTSIQKPKSNNIEENKNSSINTNTNNIIQSQSKEKDIVEQNIQTVTNSSNSSNNNNEEENRAKETEIKEEIQDLKKEEYVKNDEMINKIQQVIKNNESEFMKMYGYEVIVDSSIKTRTNQFTYTENRVKAYLSYKFGTIKIYAEDYYVNGQLVMTECYIL